MSSLVKGSPATNAASKADKATVHPVQILDGPLPTAVAAGRPALLVGLLILRFGSLVEDPVSTLKSALPIVAAVQIAYAVLCLPAAGSLPGKASRKPRPGDKRKTDTTGPSPVSTAILATALTAFATPAIYILFVLFGAPFLDHIMHTFLCASHFALLALLPTFYVRGVDKQALVALAGAYAPLDETFGGLAGAVLGAWLGAVPIPLDWDREWQKWPVTIIVGMYLGSCVVSKVAGTLLYGMRFGGPHAKEE